MPDITLCTNCTCPSFAKCYRAQAVPDPHWQSYGWYVVDEGAEKCEHFAPIEKGDKV